MKKNIENISIEKIPTNIEGFDFISLGGLPKGRTTLVTGTAGSAKTVFASQFLSAGITVDNQPGVFVTFEESPKDIREFTIDGEGMHIGKPFRNVSGILSGNIMHRVPNEIERIEGLFKDR